MITSGLVSVTFRNKTPEQVCEACVRAGLKAVEWGGDVHVPAGDMDTARRVRELSRAFGLEICAYGSYFRAGDDISEFVRSLDTASELGAPLMRIWCGRRGSAQSDTPYREMLVGQLNYICALAKQRGMLIALEFHGGTLTDDVKSVEQLMAETGDIENLRFYWQPRWDWSEEARLSALELVKPRLAHIHAFTWTHTPDIVRLELEKGAEMWKKALKTVPDCHALIEFVKHDSDEALLADAAALNRWIAEIAKENGEM